MKILLINKYYYLKGGSEKYLFELENLLKANGHQVHIFSMKDEKNLQSSDEQFFVSQADFKKNNLFKNLKELKNVFYRRQAVTNLKKLITQYRPDIVHLNNINFQLTTSIIDYLKKEKIPMVMTLHDYQLICPNHLLYTKGKYCQRCLNKNFFQCLKYKCYDNSFSRSFIAAGESYFNHWRRVYDKIDLFISPSNFLKEKMVQFGFKEERIKVLPNFLNLTKYQDKVVSLKEDFYLYVGRLEKQKGIKELVDFFNQRTETLKIIGTGELEQDLKSRAKSNIIFYGNLPNDQAMKILASAKALIVPSLWPENCPYVVLEAMVLKTPVIATASGGLPELVPNDFLFDNYDELADILSQLKTNKFTSEKLTKNVGDFSKNFSQEKYYQHLISLYKSLV